MKCPDNLNNPTFFPNIIVYWRTSWCLLPKSVYGGALQVLLHDALVVLRPLPHVHLQNVCTLYNVHCTICTKCAALCFCANIQLFQQVSKDIFRYIWAVINLCLRIYYQKKLIADPVIRTSIKKDYINKFWLKVLPKNCSIHDQTLKERITKPFNLCFVIKTLK